MGQADVRPPPTTDIRVKAMSQTFVAILMGSDSYLPVVEAAFDILRKFDIRFEAKVTSAYRTPEATKAYVQDAEARGCAVFICAAGMAAHLAGAVSAITLRPVIGLPMSATLDGVDALLTTVQMPVGTPVATVAMGKAGAKNAAYLAAQIIGIGDTAVLEKLKAERADSAAQLRAKDAALQEKLKG